MEKRTLEVQCLIDCLSRGFCNLKQATLCREIAAPLLVRKRSRLFRGLVLVGALCAVWRCCVGQARDPRAFFPEGFVLPKGQSTNVKGDKNRTSQQNAIVLGDEQVIRKENTAGLFVSVYVNALDREHSKMVINRALALHLRGRMRVLVIGHFGSTVNISEEQQHAIEEAGITLVQVREMPLKLPTTQSPTWIISTGVEHYVFDGVVHPEQFFSLQGDFIPPIGVRVEDKREETEAGNLDGF